MRTGKGVEWAMHTLLNLAWLGGGEPVPTAQLAAGHDLSPSYLNKQLQQLVKAGLLESVPGARGGFRLARPLEAVSLLDVVVAVEGDEPLFTCAEIRRCGTIGERCPNAAFTRPCAVRTAMGRAETAWRKALAEQSLADVQASSDAHSADMATRVRQAFGVD
ncbi:RrF2 family transcriptional regulator [Streptomyces chromofuscus]|uniref:Rrf2 family transcriptional regulator n=1 Tax=Streptomyces chromofuscus TaxID=42881 RepID=A0A7M2TA56_STRCW|nr:Rrf2 family transcriptional regulator [Streptomyces chromofuscus]QOV44598.1 Rrf2 family transcriptional regulator [Streptomyces chromofuscus]GGT01960.1 Rrf2 family transcriptional regulator [Streptomyces chromofuscus]